MNNKLEVFTTSLDDDLAWRKKEVSNLILMHNEGNDLVIVKATLLLIYSHWEGFVKNACKSYLAYIASLSLELDKLTFNFEAIKLKGKVNDVINSSDSYTMQNELKIIEHLYNNNNQKFSLNSKFKNERDKSIINTRDNLNTNVFSSFLLITGLGNRKCIELKSKYISEKVLDNRNKIAHGNRIPSYNFDFDQKIDDIKITKDILFLIMGSLAEDLQYYAENELYLHKNSKHCQDYNKKSNDRLEKKLNEIDHE